MITKSQLAAMIDHTYVKPYATEEDMFRLCDEAIQYGFAMVAVNSGQTERCANYIRSKGSKVHTGAAISFPLGQMTIEAKVFETKDAIEKGADEIDYVINITELKKKNYDYIRDEMKQITDLCHSHGVIIKVIFETFYLTDEEKIKLCEIASEVKPDLIKTSTGMCEGGATVEDVRLMREHTSPDVKVKASGGVRTLEQTLAFIEAGAERIGTSQGVKIVESLED
ncbi:MAG: deoxyribose-phosphate aldolase [Erysipelotrichaceae bacterium]|nr:deoxyribose-phosphate aldolase [Erysipelotrichaceae bacterium]